LLTTPHGDGWGAAFLQSLDMRGMRPGRRAVRQLEKDCLILKRASAPRPSGEGSDDDYDVLAHGLVVGRIFKVNAAPVGEPWMWTLQFEHHKDRTPSHGYAETRGRYGGVRQDLAARMKIEKAPQSWAGLG
jgi:hypothetical protein